MYLVQKQMKQMTGPKQWEWVNVGDVFVETEAAIVKHWRRDGRRVHVEDFNGDKDILCIQDLTTPYCRDIVISETWRQTVDLYYALTR